MCKLITDYLKRSCSAPLSTEERSSFSTVKTSSSSQTTRAIHLNEEKSTNENNGSIPVQCQPGPDYSFPTKQFGKKKRSCQASWFKNFSWLHYSKEKDSVFCIFCIRNKGKLTAEHNMEETYSRRDLIIGRKLLKHFLMTNNLKHIELQ